MMRIMYFAYKLIILYIINANIKPTTDYKITLEKKNNFLIFQANLSIFSFKSQTYII